MEAIHDAPFYDAATSNSACLPFVVAAHKNSQDRLIIGPSIFANNQIQLFNWLYRDIAPTMRLPAFRLGKALDFVVAARIYPIDIKETISSRRDGVVVVGLVAERGSPAALCSHLGLVVRQIAAVVAREELSLPGETEASLMALLGYTVAQTPLSFDWSSRAQLALDLCAEIPRFERIRQARRLWPWKRQVTFAALLENRASTPLQFRVASEFWRSGDRSDLTIAFDDYGNETGSSKLLYQLGSAPESPLVLLEGRSVQFDDKVVKIFYL